MRFFHLSDLHIGKQLHHYNLREDQEAILEEVVSYARELHPDAVVIAGDVYDKPVPSAEAVSIFDKFLTALSEIKPSIPLLIISGNHDSAERLEYASGILGRQNIYIAGDLPKNKEQFLKRVTLQDAHGPVNFYLMPFLKPGYVRGVFEENVPQSYSEAVQRLIEREEVPAGERNILVSHQFYTGKGKQPETCDSEVFSVGGIDNVDSGSIGVFDYAALGHIHGAQQVGEERIRYCGTLLKYSVSESAHEKVLTVVTLAEKGTTPLLEKLPLHPLRDVRRVRGSLDEILAEAVKENQEDYISIVLTDEEDAYRPKEQLERVYTHILEIRVDNQRTRQRLEEFEEAAEETDPLTAFCDFYKEIQGKELSPGEQNIIEVILEDVKGV